MSTVMRRGWSTRHLLSLGAFFAYGASYLIVFLGLIGPFFSAPWLLTDCLLASAAGLRPSRPGLISAAAGFAACPHIVYP